MYVIFNNLSKANLASQFFLHLAIEYVIYCLSTTNFKRYFLSFKELFVSTLFGFIGGVLTVLVFKLLEWMGEKRLENTEKKKQPQENDERSS